MKYETYNITATTDADGDYSKSIVVNGEIDSVMIDYAADVAAGCDVTISNDFSETIVNVANNKTDKTVYPVVQQTDNTGSEVEGIYKRYTANSLTITIADGGDSKVVKLNIRVWS